MTMISRSPGRATSRDGGGGSGGSGGSGGGSGDVPKSTKKPAKISKSLTGVGGKFEGGVRQWTGSGGIGSGGAGTKSFEEVAAENRMAADKLLAAEGSAAAQARLDLGGADELREAQKLYESEKATVVDTPDVLISSDPSSDIAAGYGRILERKAAKRRASVAYTTMTAGSGEQYMVGGGKPEAYKSTVAGVTEFIAAPQKPGAVVKPPSQRSFLLGEHRKEQSITYGGPILRTEVEEHYKSEAEAAAKSREFEEWMTGQAQTVDHSIPEKIFTPYTILESEKKSYLPLEPLSKYVIPKIRLGIDTKKVSYEPIKTGPLKGYKKAPLTELPQVYAPGTTVYKAPKKPVEQLPMQTMGSGFKLPSFMNKIGDFTIGGVMRPKWSPYVEHKFGLTETQFKKLPSGLQVVAEKRSRAFHDVEIDPEARKLITTTYVGAVAGSAAGFVAGGPVGMIPGGVIGAVTGVGSYYAGKAGASLTEKFVTEEQASMSIVYNPLIAPHAIGLSYLYTGDPRYAEKLLTKSEMAKPFVKSVARFGIEIFTLGAGQKAAGEIGGVTKMAYDVVKGKQEALAAQLPWGVRIGYAKIPKQKAFIVTKNGNILYSKSVGGVGGPGAMGVKPLEIPTGSPWFEESGTKTGSYLRSELASAAAKKNPIYLPAEIHRGELALNIARSSEVQKYIPSVMRPIDFGLVKNLPDELKVTVETYHDKYKDNILYAGSLPAESWKDPSIKSRGVGDIDPKIMTNVKAGVVGISSSQFKVGLIDAINKAGTSFIAEAKGKPGVAIRDTKSVWNKGEWTKLADIFERGEFLKEVEGLEDEIVKGGQYRSGIDVEQEPLISFGKMIQTPGEQTARKLTSAVSFRRELLPGFKEVGFVNPEVWRMKDIGDPLGTYIPSMIKDYKGKLSTYPKGLILESKLNAVLSTRTDQELPEGLSDIDKSFLEFNFRGKKFKPNKHLGSIIKGTPTDKSIWSGSREQLEFHHIDKKTDKGVLLTYGEHKLVEAMQAGIIPKDESMFNILKPGKLTPKRVKNLQEYGFGKVDMSIGQKPKVKVKDYTNVERLKAFPKQKGVMGISTMPETRKFISEAISTKKDYITPKKKVKKEEQFFASTGRAYRKAFPKKKISRMYPTPSLGGRVTPSQIYPTTLTRRKNILDSYYPTPTKQKGKPYKTPYTPPYIPTYKQPPYTPTYTPPYITPSKTPPYTPSYTPPYTPTYKQPPYTPTYTPPYTPTYTPPYTPTYTPPYTPPKTPTYTPPYTPPYSPPTTVQKTPPKTFILPPISRKTKDTVPGWDVYVKRKQVKKGKGSYQSRGYRKANEQPLSKSGAFILGAETVDKYTNRSFTLRKSDKPVKVHAVQPIHPTKYFKRKFRTKKGNKNIFVEKTSYAIDSTEEKLGIPYESVRQRKAGTLNVKPRKKPTNKKRKKK